MNDEEPARVDESTPLYSRHRTSRNDGLMGGLRNTKYVVLTVCIGSLIAVASYRGAPRTFLGLAQVPFSGQSSSVGVTAPRYASNEAITPYTSRRAAPRMEAPRVEVRGSNRALDRRGEVVNTTEGDRSKEYASIQVDNAEQLDVDFHKSQEALEKFKSITDNQLGTLREQVAELSKVSFFFFCAVQ